VGHTTHLPIHPSIHPLALSRLASRGRAAAAARLF
jgi:hypothetical protein